MILIDRRASPLAILATLALATAGCGTPRSDTSTSALPECQACHGGVYGNAAPPRAVNGDMSTTVLAVGAHQAHLADSEFRKAIACEECHVVPQSGTHADGVVALTFGTLATSGGAPAAWHRDTATCSGVHCHGDTLAAGGTYTKPVWNSATTVELNCSSCHGNPPRNHVANSTDCNACHPLTVLTDGTIDVAGGHHINGVVEAPAALACDGCHGAPPDTGAHRAHVGFVDLASLTYGDEWRTEELDPTGAQGRYSFGCGTCHPKDAARHQDGIVQVSLTPAEGVPGGLKEKNSVGAFFDGASCSNVYCHSSGQAKDAALGTPVFATTPAWSSGTSPGCGGCHGNPPSYPNGGPGSASANSHIFVNWYGSEGGHFAGLPGPTFHKSSHGSPASKPGQQAAPITCQACHADTVNPANVLPGGFFYADTSVTTRLPNGRPGLDPARLTTQAWKDTQCDTCHGVGGGPGAVAGAVRPLRHVNGSRDVAFDRRDGTDLPAGWFSGLGASAPSRPYFMTGATFFTSYTLPADAGWDMATPPPPAPGQRETLSYQLTSAGYTPATQTCSSVACHLGNGVRWGQKDLETATPTCTGCHGIQ